MGSSLNNASMISADDFFTMNRYKGDIYKAVNLQDRLLANYCADDSALIKEQKRIEKQLADVQEHVYGRDSAYYAKLRADSLEQAVADSLAQAGKSARSARRTTARRSTGVSARRSSGSSSSGSSSKTAKTKTPKATKPKSSGGSSGKGLSVRRQRH